MCQTIDLRTRGHNMTFSWTDENTQTLRELHRKGLTNDEIAKHINAPGRSIVSGKIKSLGLPKRSEIDRSTRSSIYAQRNSSPPRISKAARKPKNPDIQKSFGTPAPLIDLKPHQCLWPINDDKGRYIFCGANHTTTKPYCPRHQAVATTKKAPTAKEKENQNGHR